MSCSPNKKQIILNAMQQAKGSFTEAAKSSVSSKLFASLDPQSQPKRQLKR